MLFAQNWIQMSELQTGLSKMPQKAETFQHFLDGIRNEIEAITLLSRLGEPIV